MSIVVDLRHPQGRDVVLRLCGQADVLVHNSRREAMSRLGSSYADLSRVKPDIVYCAAVGFGEASRGFRAVRGFRDMKRLVAALAQRVQPTSEVRLKVA